MRSAASHPAPSSDDDGERRRVQPAAPRQRRAQQPRRPQRDAGVDQAEEQRRADQPELRHEHQRKQQRRPERAEVVEGQHVRDDVLEVEAVAQDAHQQRDLEPHQHADDDDQHVEHDAEAGRVGEGDEQHRRREAADQADQQLDDARTASPARARRSATASDPTPIATRYVPMTVENCVTLSPSR